LQAILAVRRSGRTNHKAALIPPINNNDKGPSKD